MHYATIDNFNEAPIAISGRLAVEVVLMGKITDLVHERTSLLNVVHESQKGAVETHTSGRIVASEEVHIVHAQVLEGIEHRGASS